MKVQYYHLKTVKFQEVQELLLETAEHIAFDINLHHKALIKIKGRYYVPVETVRDLTNKILIVYLSDSRELVTNLNDKLETG